MSRQRHTCKRAVTGCMFVGTGQWDTFRNITDFFPLLSHLGIIICKQMDIVIIILYCFLVVESNYD